MMAPSQEGNPSLNSQAAKSTRTPVSWLAQSRASLQARNGEALVDPGALEDGIHGLQWWKRATDVVLSVLGLIASLPVLAIAVPVIKLTSPGPAIYRQERVGLNRRLHERRRDQVPNGRDRRVGDRRGESSFGKPFTMYKLRTMTTDAEVGEPTWAEEKDPRVTPVGRILRKTRIDEIPQFYNVLRGDMSIVGPRPERAYFFAEAAREIPDFKLRLRAKPGITGLAQVTYGYTNTVKGLDRKLRFDLEYISSMSLRTDLKILLRTISVVLTGKGAY